MQKHLKIAAFTIIISSLFILPCVSQGSQENALPDRPSGSSQESDRPEMPQPTGSELSLLRLKVLFDNPENHQDLAITSEQAKALLTILKDWEDAVSSNPDAETGGYIAGIAAELTEAQNAFIPGPPAGPRVGGSGPGGDRGEKSDKGEKGQRPQGGPEKIEISSLLIELIEYIEGFSSLTNIGK